MFETLQGCWPSPWSSGGACSRGEENEGVGRLPLHDHAGAGPSLTWSSGGACSRGEEKGLGFSPCMTMRALAQSLVDGGGLQQGRRVGRRGFLLLET